MPYCPNCAAPVAAGAKECTVCNATFEPGSAWQQLAEPPHDARRTTARRVRVLVVVSVWCAFFFSVQLALRTIGTHRSELPYLSLATLSLGIALLTGEFAAAAVERGSVRGTIALSAIAEFMRRPYSRMAVAVLVLLSTPVIAVMSFIVLGITLQSFFIHPNFATDLLFHVAGWAALAGLCATWTSLFVSRDALRRSPKLYWSMLAGLVIGLVTVLPLLGMRLAVPVPLYSRYINPSAAVLATSHAIGLVMLLLAHVGMRR